MKTIICTLSIAMLVLLTSCGGNGSTQSGDRNNGQQPSDAPGELDVTPIIKKPSGGLD